MLDIVVIIPAWNEEDSICHVIHDIPKGLVGEIVVVNNNSSDDTFKKARSTGAVVLEEKRQGYGFACLKGIEYVKGRTRQADIVVFLDADYSDYPEHMEKLVRPIIEENYDMVIGSRTLGKRQKGSMLPQQVFGNWLATKLLRLFYGVTYTDLGPFRAIKLQKLISLNMQDTTYGWTVEMQLKAAKQRLKVCEIPVNYRKRIGISKITGTLRGTIMAGYRIIFTIFKYL